MGTYVISIGGSAIVPGKININFLKKLKKTVKKISRNNKIILVCGGGYPSRKYMDAARALGASESLAALAGIRTTKLNATLVALATYGGIEMPDSLKEVGKLLKKHNIIVCGALGFQPNMTSDGDAADIARYMKAKMFINLTDVSGLYDKNPKKYKSAKFIPKISFNEFSKITSKIKYKPGQHFVLDQAGSKIIKKHRIKTVILKGLDNLERVILGKKFKGTTIN